MSQNPPNLRPDIAQPRFDADRRQGQPSIGMVSLGCPKALVDSERILTRLRAEGYGVSPDYQGADAVIVNTCGFLDSAKAESLEAIGEALSENGRVIVTGCLGAEPEYITGVHPRVLAVTGPHQYEQVLDAVHGAVPPSPDPFVDLLPAGGVKLTPRHYSYLKISEGCNHACKFCIIPDMRGKLASRPHRAVLREAEKLVEAGVKELLVISQDTSAYGTDWKDRTEKAPILSLARDLGELGAWVRMHYVYPYPHVRELIPLMAEGKVLPYLDIPFQHAHPDTLKRMARPCGRGPHARRDRRVAPPPAPRSSCARPSSSAIRAKRKTNFRCFWTGWTRRNWTGSGVFSMRTSPGRGLMICPITSRQRSNRTAGIGSWPRRRRFPKRSSPPRWAAVRRSSSMRSMARPRPVAPWPTRRRSTAICSSTKASRG